MEIFHIWNHDQIEIGVGIVSVYEMGVGKGTSYTNTYSIYTSYTNTYFIPGGLRPPGPDSAAARYAPSAQIKNLVQH